MSVIKGDWAQGNACEILFKPTIKIGDYTVELYNHSDYDKVSPLIELPFDGYYIDASKCVHCKMCVNQKYLRGGCMMDKYLRTKD